MKKWGSKVNSIIDATSWVGILLLWITTVLLALLRQSKNDSFGILGGANGPIAITFSSKPGPYMLTAIIGTVVFIILTVFIRLNPQSILSSIFRYLRLIFLVLTCYFVMVYIISGV